VSDGIFNKEAPKMEPLQNESKSQYNLWALLKKALLWLFCADWEPPSPGQPKNPREYREESLNKCPWKDFW
jgi:hypothetical protein